jgi:hypothetical protein
VQTLLEFLSGIRPVLETLYFLSAIGVFIAVWVAVQQLRTTKQIADTGIKREAANLAAIQCRYLAENSIPALHALQQTYNNNHLTFLTTALNPNQPLIELKELPVLHFENANHDPTALQQQWPTIAKPLTDYLNGLEYFAMLFTIGVADEQVAYRTAALPFIMGVNFCIVGLHQMRTAGLGRFDSTLKLYLTWHKRLAIEVAASHLPALQQMVQNATTNRIGVIGSDVAKGGWVKRLQRWL